MSTSVALKVNLSTLLRQQNDLDSVLLRGFDIGRHGGKRSPSVDASIMSARAGRGFKEVVSDFLTPPSSNDKLRAASVPSYGLTLAHEKLHERLNLCPWAGDCTKVCVLNNGNGAYDSVRRAWLWRTDFLSEHPHDAVWQMGWELGRAVRRHGRILFRPDVNSDLSWHRFLPALGTLPMVTVYGYTKSPAVFSGHKLLKHWGFNYAYSHNEKSDREREASLLREGGRIAVVTSREKGRPTDPWALRRFFGVGPEVAVVDADVTDQWMLADYPVIGDLSAKGQARRLIGKSDFVVVI